MIFNNITMRGKDERIVQRIEQMNDLSADATFHVRLVIPYQARYCGYPDRDLMVVLQITRRYSLDWILGGRDSS